MNLLAYTLMMLLALIGCTYLQLDVSGDGNVVNVHEQGPTAESEVDAEQFTAEDITEDRSKTK